MVVQVCHIPAPRLGLHRYTLLNYFFLSSASGIGILYSFAKVVPEADIFVTELQQWIVSFFALTLATNLLCTGLVAYRIWAVNRATMVGGRRSYRPVVFLVLESGAVYSATLAALLVLYKTSSWFQYVLLDAVRERRRSGALCHLISSLTHAVFFFLSSPAPLLFCF